METCLNRLYKTCLSAKESNRFTFEFQDLVLVKSGECINKIVELERGADLSKNYQSRKFRPLFSKNVKILDIIRSINQENITEIQEEKLDNMEDVDAFLASPQWQTPHRPISLARYWTSWNEYYSSFLYQDDDSIRTNLLSKAIKGFSLTLTDIEERVMVIKALFGRALGFKELGKYKESIRDFDYVIQKARQDDPLYIQSLYENANLNYQTGDFHASLDQLNKLEKAEDQKKVIELLGDNHLILREKALFEPRIKKILLDLKKEKNKQGKNAKNLCRDGLYALKKLSDVDVTHISRLYQLANEYALIYKDYMNDELGPVACLGVADRFFKRKDYKDAVKRYTSLWNSSHPMAKRRMDDIYLRSGYCYCRTGQWHNAINCFDILFNKFPVSDSLDKAACLQYFAARNSYEVNPDKTNYTHYIKSIKRYLKACSDAKDKNGARFQLGKYYHGKGKTKKATKEFSKIGEDSAYYWPANYYLLKYDMDKLESLYKKGRRQRNNARKYYRKVSSQIEKFNEFMKNNKNNPGINEVAPYMAILHGRLVFDFGPEARKKDAFKILNRFEGRFPYNQKIFLEAKNLRMKYFMKYKMFPEAQKEVKKLSLKGKIDRNHWAFLNEWAEAYYKESRKLRHKGNGKSAGLHALTAIMIYAKMSDIASRQADYSKYLDAVQLRWAELYSEENRYEKAGNIYLMYLKRNPNSAEALNNLGNIYEKEGKWQAALEIWRRFCKGLESGSDQWFEYRWRIIHAYSMMKMDKEACEIISMTQVLHPNPGNQELIVKMQDLKNKVCP